VPAFEVAKGNLNRTKLGTKIQISAKFRDLLLIFITERNLNKKSYCWQFILRTYCFEMGITNHQLESPNWPTLPSSMLFRTINARIFVNIVCINGLSQAIY
jgi:hypothetical protein